MINIKNITSLKKESLPARFRSDLNDVQEAISVGLYKTDKDVKKIIDALISQINIENSQPKKQDLEAEDSVIKMRLELINVDKKRFQNRTKLNDKILQNIVDNYNPTILDPLIVWEDPTDNKTYLLAGHHRLEATRIKGIKKIAVKYFSGSEAEAINFAKVESNANRSLETPIERAKIYRDMRKKGLSKKDVIAKAQKIEGKNASYIVNLSYLSENGIVLSNLDSLENADKQNIAIIEKIADWAGQAFRNYGTLLSKAHESEIYNFLISKDSSRIKTKSEFLQKINSIVSSFVFDGSKPLNLKKFKYKSEGEDIYNQEFSELKEKINTLIEKKAALKKRFTDPKSPDFIDPKKSYYKTASKELDKQVNKITNDVKFYQNKLINLQQNKSNYVNAGSNQAALFGVNQYDEFIKKAITTTLKLLPFKGLISHRQAFVLFKNFGSDAVIDTSKSFSVTTDYEKAILDRKTKFHTFNSAYNKKPEVLLKQPGVLLINAINKEIKSIIDEKELPGNANGLKVSETETYEPIYIDLQQRTVTQKNTKTKSVEPQQGAKLHQDNKVVKTKPLTAVKSSNAVVNKPGNLDIPSKYLTAAQVANAQKEPSELFNITGDLQKLLGNLEIKPVHSLLVTLDSEEGGGKTHSFYQWANVFASAGYRSIIWSLEEHKTSALSKDKAAKYFSEKAYNSIVIESENDGENGLDTFNRLIDSIEDFEVVFIDSLPKLVELNNKLSVDLDLRKKFNGKLIFLILQRTSDGKPRGGSKASFDGDVILKVNVDREDFRNNYVFNHKNRYNEYTPLSALKYSPYHQKLITDSAPKEEKQTTGSVTITSY